MLRLSPLRPLDPGTVPARVLYAEVRILARAAGLREVRAEANSWDDYPYEVGIGGGVRLGVWILRSRWYFAASFR